MVPAMPRSAYYNVFRRLVPRTIPPNDSTILTEMCPAAASVIFRRNELSVVSASSSGVFAYAARGAGLREDGVIPRVVLSDKNDDVVERVDSNLLEANRPVEDFIAESSINHSRGNLFGVFDGHGGPECANAVAQRLPCYLSLFLTPPSLTRRLLRERQSGTEQLPISTELKRPLLSRKNDDRFNRATPTSCFEDDLWNLAEEIVAEDDDEDLDEEDVFAEHFYHIGWRPEFVEAAFKRAFLRLDADLSRAALLSVGYNAASLVIDRAPASPLLFAETGVGQAARALTSSAPISSPLPEEAAFKAFASGSVATVAHVAGRNLSVASCGDSRAVLGSRLHGVVPGWIATPLSTPHDADNAAELARVLSQHPSERINDLVCDGRLLGRLQPFRAFGDAIFKWPAPLVRRLLPRSLPNFYATPPYLTAAPEVHCRSLEPQDEFLVVASDGLWDIMSPETVVDCVGRWRHKIQTGAEGKRTPRDDDNAATHLLRTAFRVRFGDDEAVWEALATPWGVARWDRDDISIVVVHFNREYLSRGSGVQG